MEVGNNLTSLSYILPEISLIYLYYYLLINLGIIYSLSVTVDEILASSSTLSFLSFLPCNL